MKRFIFPVVNAVVVAILFGLVGYYAGNFGLWVVVGLVGGLLVGLIAEFGLGRIGGWWYRRRLTLAALLQIPLIIFFIGPYGFVLGLSQPANTTICCVSPADFGAEYRTVSIPAADGITLAGWYVPPTAPHGAVIILLHGGGGNRTGTMWHAARLYEAGYGLLMYDQRAVGESTGTTQSFGWLDERDVPAVIDFLIEQPEVNPDRIGGLGLSLGAHILIMAGPDEPRLKALFLDGTGAGRTSDFPESQNFGEQFAFILNVQIERANQFHLGVSPPTGFVEQIPKLAPRPVLMVVGALDDFENRVNQRYTALLGENGEQWMIENAHHVGGAWTVPEAYTARMLDFFEQALLQ